MDRGAWWAAVHGVTKSDMTEWLSTSWLMVWNVYSWMLLTIHISSLQKCLFKSFVVVVVVVELLSHVWLFATPWTAAYQASPSFYCLLGLFKFRSIESVMPSNYIIICHHLFLLPSVFPSIRIFSSELSLYIRWPSIGTSASESVLPMNIQGWFPLGLTGLTPFQSKRLSSIFSISTISGHQFFKAQPSLWLSSHIHTWLLKKTIALTIWTLVCKVICLFFNMLSSFVIVFLPRSKCFLISWLQSPSTVILKPKKITSVTDSNFSPSICH